MAQQRVYQLGASQLTLAFGDLVTSTAQVLVSSDDFYLTMSGGVSAAIRRGGGNAIALDAAKRVPARVGDVVVTTAGTLPAWYVFHAVTIGPGGAEIRPEEVIRQTTKRCLSLLDPLGVSSIAFPAIGAGTARFSLDEVATCMAEVIAEDVSARADPVDVTIYLFGRNRAGTEMSAFDYARFFEEFGRRNPAMSRRATTAASLPQQRPRAGAAGSTSPRDRLLAVEHDLLDLERRRQVLEEQIVELRRTQAPQEELAAAQAELTSNQELRLGRIAEQHRMREAGVKLFISYAHEDEASCEALLKHLSSLRLEGVVTDWYDRKIAPGTEFDQEIEREMNAAHLILLLVSPDFMSSSYIADVEVRLALARHRAGEARVIPVIVRSVDWQHGPLGKLSALPPDGRPVDRWPNQDEALLKVVEGIRRVLAPTE